MPSAATDPSTLRRLATRAVEAAGRRDAPGFAAAAVSAPELAERLRAACPAPQTVSVGVVHRRPGESAGELLARADAQLYRAKAAGRDRVCVG